MVGGLMPPFGRAIFLLDVSIAGAHSHRRIPHQIGQGGKPLGIVGFSYAASLLDQNR
jgi:hypothetical protein